MKLNFVTPEKEIITNVKVDEILVPAFRGQLNLLPGHSPIMTTLSTGILKYKLEGETKFNEVAISWGYCCVSGNEVTILADTAETAEEIDKERTLNSLKFAKDKIESLSLDADQVIKYQRKLKKAETRLELLK